MIKENQIAGSKLYWVANKTISDSFPPVDLALRDPDGLLAIGGDLTTERLLDAYSKGIFPWFDYGQPILWWSPDPRCILYPGEMHISKTLEKILKKNLFKVTFNNDFHKIIRMCAKPRNGKANTWITKDIIDAYTLLDKDGHILSVECWYNEKLVGGIYGVIMGQIYFGESMFSSMSNASKIALFHLTNELKKRDFKLIDCQIFSKHLNSLGARSMPRNDFIDTLKYYCQKTKKYSWPVK